MTFRGPAPQSRATSVATSETTSTVAGLARRTISCSDIVSAAQAFGGAWAASAKREPSDDAEPRPGEACFA